MTKPVFKYKQVIILRKDIEMSTGKAVAQGCHASEEAVHLAEISNQEMVNEWRAEGFRKIVCQMYGVEAMQITFNKAKKLGIAAFFVNDFGCTELAPNTVTAVAIGPDKNELVNKVTKYIELYVDDD